MMNGKVVTIVAALLAFLVVPVASFAAGAPFYGCVVKVIDGDSLLLRAGKKNIEIRLYGVDSPEYNQPFAGKAKALAKKNVLDQNVLVRPVAYDSYQRLVAIVEYDGQSLNSELVGAGLAWVYPHYCHRKICRSWQQREDAARAEKRGLWSADRPVPPWQWRARGRH